VTRGQACATAQTHVGVQQAERVARQMQLRQAPPHILAHPSACETHRRHEG
jgi:hypothetical protein